jgi:hypothetical protein
MNKPALAITLLLAGVTSAVACSSKSSDSTGATTVVARPDAGRCTTVCCDLPVPGTTCAGSVDAGTTCTYAVTCPEGLVLSRSTTCESGTWQAVNDCPAPGGADLRGCPASQPTNGTPCALDGGSNGACGYSKTCDAKSCDGSDCVSVHSSAQANCINGVWQTTPIGPC